MPPLGILKAEFYLVLIALRKIQTVSKCLISSFSKFIYFRRQLYVLGLMIHCPVFTKVVPKSKVNKRIS